MLNSPTTSLEPFTKRYKLEFKMETEDLARNEDSNLMNSTSGILVQPDGNQTFIHYPREASYFAAACAILFTVIGIAGNLLTIIALARSRKLRSHATTAFVMSLAASDLIFCLFNMPLTASRYIHESWVLGETLCELFPFFFYGNVACSLMSMVGITLNRYILIASPSLYNKLYQRKFIALMIFGIWAFSFSILIPTLFQKWGQFGLDPPTFSCTILRKNGKSPKKFLFVFGFLLPCLAIIVSYTCIFIKVRRSRLNVLSHSPAAHTNSSMITNGSGSAALKKSNTEKQQRREDWRLTRMMLTIFCCFLLCFLPLMVVNVADDDVTVPTIHVLSSILAWASSVINPFIYAFANRQYRSAYRHLFTGRRPTSTSLTQSRSSGKTFFTEMLHYTTHGDKVKVVRAQQESKHSQGGLL